MSVSEPHFEVHNCQLTREELVLATTSVPIRDNVLPPWSGLCAGAGLG